MPRAARPTSAGTTRRPRLAERRRDERAWAVDVYSRRVRRRAAAAAGRAARCSPRLAARYRLAILSNWPLAATIDRYARRPAGRRHLRARSSCRSGSARSSRTRRSSRRRAAALGDPPPAAILHVGDDWAADVVGAKPAGWRAAYLGTGRHDSPLPGQRRATTRSTRTWSWTSSSGDLERRCEAAPATGRTGAPSVDSLAMEARDRIANLGAAGRAGGGVDRRRASSSRPATRTGTRWPATSARSRSGSPSA